jgi:hypothetical protein
LNRNAALVHSRGNSIVFNLNRNVALAHSLKILQAQKGL